MELIFDGSETPISGLEVVHILEEMNGQGIALVQDKQVTVENSYLILLPGPFLYKATGYETCNGCYARPWYGSWEIPIVIENRFDEAKMLRSFAPDEDDGI